MLNVIDCICNSPLDSKFIIEYDHGKTLLDVTLIGFTEGEIYDDDVEDYDSFDVGLARIVNIISKDESCAFEVGNIIEISKHTSPDKITDAEGKTVFEKESSSGK